MAFGIIEHAALKNLERLANAHARRFSIHGCSMWKVGIVGHPHVATPGDTSLALLQESGSVDSNETDKMEMQHDNVLLRGMS